MKSLLLDSPEQTRMVGALIGKLLKAGDVIALEGDLGSGKTTLTQGIALGMGVRQFVNSPTYAIIHEYEGAVPLFHCDPYRLKSADALASIGFEEYFERGGVVIVEWANLVSELLPEERLLLAITTIESLDNTFDVDGKLLGDYKQGNTTINATVIQSDGKVVIAGSAWNGNDFDFAIVRYNTNGSFDNTFSDDGKLLTDFGANDEGISLVLQPDGKIIVFGTSSAKFAISRYNTDGTLDATFSDDGKLLISIGLSDLAKSVALQADGKIILAGHTYIDVNFDSAYFAIARINSNGTLDNTFSSDGKVFTNFENSPSFANAVTIQNDGKIVAAGRSYINGHNNFSLARYNSDGSLDNTFSLDGKQNTVFGTNDYFGMSMAIQPDGKIVVAGFEESISQGSTSFLVARYNANGDLDNNFNGVGFRTTQAESKFNFGFCVAINIDGRIAIGGTNNNFKIALLQYYRANFVVMCFGNF